ncbi:glycosyltransferase [Patescibacteria group bacterium]|nr:glycosyltransferase [Patescibacteria group bacterium]
MAKVDLYNKDISERERASLDYVLAAEKRLKNGADVPVVSVEQALKEESVYEAATTRDIVRVLFISLDETLLNPTKQSLDGFIDLSELFDEVHILILRTGIPAKFPVLRAAKNVWIYTASARYSWWVPVVGMRLIHQELVFVGGMRPDLIVARDPFESALVASLVGQRYGRPVQLHVLHDYAKSSAVSKLQYTPLRRLLSRWLIPRFASIRTATFALQEHMAKQHPVPDIATLPRFNSYDSLLAAPSTRTLQEKYPAYAFIMLYLGQLGHESSVYRVMDASRSFLRNPRVGLVIVGDGPARKEFEKRAALLGIEKQVVFETQSIDIVSYLKSAHLLIVSDTDSDGDDAALKGAAAGIPLVIAHNQFRDDIFVDGSSAMLFRPDSVEELHSRINTVLNEVGLRRQIALRAQEEIRSRFHDDPETYRLAYRSSIEHALFDSTQVTESPPTTNS